MSTQAPLTVPVPAHPLVPEAAPAQSSGPPPLAQALRGAWHALPRALAHGLYSGTALAGSAAALAGGALLTLLLGGVLKAPPQPQATPPAAQAASYVLGFVFLALALARTPRADDRPWAALSAWIQLALWTAAACAGLKWGGGANVGWNVTLTLAAYLCAYEAAVLGFSSLLAVWLGRYAQAGRMGMAFVLALVIAGLLWTRTPLLALYKQDRALGRWGADAVLNLSPATGFAAVWNGGPGGHDLLKGEITYQRWVGMYDLLPYPRLWPERYARIQAPPPTAPPGTPPLKVNGINPGLVLAFGSWGLVLLLLAETARGGRIKS